MTGAWAVAGALALSAAQTLAAQGVRPADVPREYGLDLAAATPVMHHASDVTFDGDSVHDSGGVLPLPGSEATFSAVQTTRSTALPLQAGADYLVNDRSGKTWVLHVTAFDAAKVSVTVAPSAATLRRQGRARQAARTGPRLTAAGARPRSP